MKWSRAILRWSPRELAPRIRQEIANLALLARPPQFDGALAPAPLPRLPDPDAVCASLKDTSFARRTLETASLVMAHRFPLLGTTIDTGAEIRWRRDYLHGQESPLRYFRRIPYLDFSRAGDHKIVWELNRHQHLTLLAMAWRFTGEEEYRNEIVRQLESWWAGNPFLRGINWASALEAAFRAMSWTWVYHLAGNVLDERFRRRLMASLYQHGSYLEHNLSWRFSPNTHLLGEAVALHALGCLFPQFPASARWEAAGRAAVLSQMDRQVRDDGSHFEQSSYYHVYALDMFLFHAVLAPVPDWYRRKLRLMAEYLDALAGSGRRLPLIGDDDGGRWFYPYGPREDFAKASLATCAVMLDCDAWTYEAEDLPEQAAWWLGPQRPREPAASKPRESRFFPEAGLFVMRAQRAELIFDAGPFGPWGAGHSHSDTLSLLARLNGDDILVDAGTYTYVAGRAARDWFRGSAAHNTVRVDGRDQAASGGPFAWREKPQVSVLDLRSDRHCDVADAVVQAHRYTHRRKVVLFKQRLIAFIGDEIGGAEGEHDIEIFWRLGCPACRERLVFDNSVSVSFTEGGEHGRRSRVFGAQEPAPVLIAAARRKLPTRFWTVLDLSQSRREMLSAEEGGCSYAGLTVSW